MIAAIVLFNKFVKSLFKIFCISSCSCLKFVSPFVSVVHAVKKSRPYRNPFWLFIPKKNVYKYEKVQAIVNCNSSNLRSNQPTTAIVAYIQIHEISHMYSVQLHATRWVTTMKEFQSGRKVLVRFKCFMNEKRLAIYIYIRIRIQKHHNHKVYCLNVSHRPKHVYQYSALD